MDREREMEREGKEIGSRKGIERTECSVKGRKGCHSVGCITSVATRWHYSDHMICVLEPWVVYEFILLKQFEDSFGVIF